MKPYSEVVTEVSITRTFSENVDNFELVWHRDKRDRIIRATSPTDWKFQFDNEVPFQIEKEIYIPKETYHRLIKGTGELVLEIKEL